jgi:hypothetical protein
VILPARTPDDRAILVAYMASKLGQEPNELVGHMPFEIVAIQRNEKTKGAVLYYNYRFCTIEMAWAGEPGWLTPGVVREMFAYPFKQLGCRTVIGLIDRNNRKSREMALGLGCKEVGVIEEAFGERRDAILYSMHRESCPWMAPRPRPVRRLKAQRHANGAYAHA